MALRQSLEKSFDRADRMVDLARAANYHKAAGGRSIDSLAAQGPMSDGKRRVNYGQAVEQYRANKGWVYSCIRAVAQRIAGQPIRVASVPKRTTRDVMLKAVASLTSTTTAKDYTGLGGVDDLKPLDQHPLLDTLADPNPLQVAWSLMFSTVASLELTGQSLWWITSDEEKRVLMPLPTHWIQSISAKRSSFTIRPEGMTETFPISGDEACLFAYPDPSNPFGALSTLQQIAEAVETDDSIQYSQRRAFKAGINQKLALVVGKMPMPSGVDRRPTLTQAQRRQLISAILTAHAGEGNEHSPIILDGMIERIDKLSIAPKEMDWLEVHPTNAYLALWIARIFSLRNS